MIIIFDLDGTLANINHRLVHIFQKPKNWEKFNSNIHLDEPKHQIIALNYRFEYAGDTIIICSGRRDECQNETIEWLNKHEIAYHELLMRQVNDHRSDVEVKRDMLNYIRNKYGEPDIAIDDRQRVVDFWRSEGITCLQCDKWEEQ